MAKRGGGLIVAIVFGPVVMIIGFLVAYFVGVPMVREAKASTNWPTVEGVVSVSKVKSQRRDNKTMYSHHIEYKYEVAGQPFEGDRVWVGATGSSSMRSFADKAVARYPVGKQVEVYYNPEEPGSCVLEPGATWTSYLPVGIGGLFCLIGMFVTAGLMLKLVAGIFFLGGAADSSSLSGVTTSHSTNSPGYSSTDDGDDGIGIT